MRRIMLLIVVAVCAVLAAAFLSAGRTARAVPLDPPSCKPSGHFQCPGPSPSPTASGSTSPSPSPSPSPTSTSTGAACTTSALNGTCGPYSYVGIPMSNGYDTYVVNQSVNPQPGTVNTLTAADPGNWSVLANETPCGGCVQTFVNSNQLTNDWNGTGWGGSGSSNTPLGSLSALTVSYSESTPRDAATVAEFAPDVWVDNAGNDVMFWADTQGRCNTGSYGPVVLGTAVLDGQTWTVNEYGTEIIFVLDSDPAIPDSCARQASGTINILAGFQWLAAHGVTNGLGNLTQLNTGWEICAADNAAFTMSGYSVTATVP